MVIAPKQVTPGPVGFDTMYEADERVRIGEEGMELGVKGVVVTFEPPNNISWINAPASAPSRCSNGSLLLGPVANSDQALPAGR